MQVFAHLGACLTIVQTGCCGMAGTFGHETRNRAGSERLYAMNWAAEIERCGSALAMATGYSCRSQIKHIDGKTIPHPFEIINALVA